MGFYEKNILPHLINLLMTGETFSKQRKTVASGLSGKVLEIGFGTGLNLPFYPQAVTELHVLDPNEKGRSLAKERIASFKRPLHFVSLVDDKYQVDSESFDFVFSTWTMCTIPNLSTALNEIKRVLKPKGKLVFLEHGLSNEKAVAKWQHRLNPLQKAIGGGCHLNRPICSLIEQAGFAVSICDTFYMEGPKIAAYMYRGEAQPIP